MTGETLFTDLREKLLHYKNADAINQQAILTDAIISLSDLGENIEGNAQAINAYQKLVYAATIINYAKTLRRIQNCGFFDIPYHFMMVDLFATEKFSELNQYFEFHKTASQMRLKIKLDAIPPSIWQLFRDAQKEQLRLTDGHIGKKEQYDFDQLDISNPSSEQLYPLPIVMYEKYQTEFVDIVWANEYGEYSFVSNPAGFFKLPGHNMVTTTPEEALHKSLVEMLNNHLANHHRNLWTKAAEHYYFIDQSQFIQELRRCINSHQNSHFAFQAQLLSKLGPYKTIKPNQQILADLVAEIDIMIAINPSDEKQQVLNELRANVQIAPLTLTSLYHDTIHFLKDHAIVKKIEQLGDTHVCGGIGISNACLLINSDLLDWFSNKFSGAPHETAPQMQSNKFVSMTLLKAIENFTKIICSNLLFAFAHQAESLQKNMMTLENVWNANEFSSARSAISLSAIGIIEAIDKETLPIQVSSPFTAGGPSFLAAPSPALLASVAALAIEPANTEPAILF